MSNGSLSTLVLHCECMSNLIWKDLKDLHAYLILGLSENTLNSFPHYN